MLVQLLLVAARLASAETVILKDGSTLRGALKQADEQNVTLETPDGTLTIKRDRVQRIDYGAAEPPAPMPSEVPLVPRSAQRRRFMVGLDLFGPANAGNDLQDDMQIGASALAGLGYSVAGSLQTKAAAGFRGSYLRPLTDEFSLGGSLGYLVGPESEGALNVAGGGLSGVLTVKREVSWFRVLLESRAHFAISERAAINLGGGVGLANGRVNQELTCAGSACTVNGSKTTSSASWSGLTWELSPEFTYSRFLAAFKVAGFPKYKGSSNLSIIKWTTTGFQLGFLF